MPLDVVLKYHPTSNPSGSPLRIIVHYGQELVDRNSLKFVNNLKKEG